MPKCPHCKKTKDLGGFAKRENGRHGSWCKVCHRELCRAHYQANKASYRARTAKAQKRVKEYIQAAKERPCMDCNVTYPSYVMDFDHVRGEKKFLLARGHQKTGFNQVIAEMAKCDVVCSNCHRIRTHGRR